MHIVWFGDSTITEVALLSLAFVLSAGVGLERGRKLKSAGLRTHTLVGLGAALFTLVSVYGFAGVAGPDANADPTRIAAQIVSGVGFLGAGVIFVHRGAVSGLTTAASIWMTAAIGMACGAGAPTLAIVATVLYFLARTLLGRLGKRVTGAHPDVLVRIRYREGFGSLRGALTIAAELGLDAVVTGTRNVSKPAKPRHESTIRVVGRGTTIDALLDAWRDLAGVMRVEPVEDSD